jgi:large subunit ribosomal protein L15
MQKHNVVRKHKNKTSAQVGRGGTRGKTSGRGTKGQNARAGHKNRPELRDFIKRFPKLRGRGKNINTSIQQKPFVISLTALSSNFAEGAMINPQTLKEKKLVVTQKGVLPKIKILGGTIDKSVIISGVEVSVSALSAIQAAGGRFESKSSMKS